MVINKIATRFTNHLLLHNFINKDYFDIYVYGFELIISFLFSTVSILLIGSFVWSIYQTAAFLIVFVLLRSFSGGYHAKTYSMCTIVTFGTYFIVMLLSNYVFVNCWQYLLLAGLGVFILSLVSPVEHPNKKTSKEQKKKHKIISLFLFVVFISMGIWLRFVYPLIGNTIFFSLIADLVLLFIKNKKRKESQYEVA